ncbi:splicing factor U2AF 50 kDa subunit-like [Hibiscus syriacus]|uniref:splicing factor U2AF 50 kDa subunit-like n=1 Tax=Hibiscus syriacus TaxID=106335 RepID=UPI0019244040|nr:splicing factor U2AF 50 kDa subunit-like [Hibiscus syriacus]
MVSGSASSNLQVSRQMVSLNMHATVNPVPSVSVTGKPLAVASTSSLSFDSVHLTEYTRPMRRLYVENVPASASEKAMMESFNNFLLSSGINHISRTKPCISCIIHKGKGRALVEFLTLEDASAALSFDGSFQTVAIFMQTGEMEKLGATMTTINDIVEDSHHKQANGIITNGENKMDDYTRETGNVQNVVDDEISVETKTTEEVAGGNSGGTAGITC